MDEKNEESLLDSTGLKHKGIQALGDEIVERCSRIVAQVQTFKQPRLRRIQLYRDLDAGNVKPKYRQPFNVVLPVFSGAMDTLKAEFNDDLAIELSEQEPADYMKVKKLDALWNMESTSVAPNAKFALKTRWDRGNALFSGRGFMMNHATSIGGYRNNFEIFELDDAIFQPRGGGHWALHMYSGRENVYRTEHDLTTGDYDATRVKELLDLAAKTDFLPEPNMREALAKFRAAGLDANSADYVGERIFQLTEMRVTVGGSPYYILFSPWYKKWVRFDRLSAVNSAGLDPWVSWATHEDNRNFLTKSYADDMYGIADAVHTLFNQELTNREKRNLNARAFDREMFPDVSKLDQAQYRPDALVPADTKGGTRQISQGLYTFETPELRGTIDLINWMNEVTGRSVGVTDLSQGGVQNVSKKATVVFAEQQNISKRLLLRSSPYTEAMGEIGKLFIAGCVDHMPAKKAIRMLGAEGEGWDEITRMDLDLEADVDVKVKSSSIEMRNSQLKKEARMKVLSEIAVDPNQAKEINPRWIVEEKLRSGGEYADPEIAVAMDTKNYGNKTEVAHAYKAIQELTQKKNPALYHAATGILISIIYDYANEHRDTLGEAMYTRLLDYAIAHEAIAAENTARKARQDASQALMAASVPGPDGAPATPADETTPLVPPVSHFGTV